MSDVPKMDRTRIQVSTLQMQGTDACVIGATPKWHCVIVKTTGVGAG